MNHFIIKIYMGNSLKWKDYTLPYALTEETKSVINSVGFLVSSNFDTRLT